MICSKSTKIPLLQFQKLLSFKELKHGTFTRLGGHSLSPYDSLNLNIDKECSDDIKLNLSDALNTFELENPVWGQQVHKDDIIVIGEQSQKGTLICDAFITRQKKTTLLIKHADCQAALFYDPTKSVIAAVHCGWRGQVLNIYRKVIEKMVSNFGCSTKDILVCISPSLGPKHAEFIHYQKEFPKIFWPFRGQGSKFNLWEVARMQLIESGILNQNIEIAQQCTYENQKHFFSYRRDQETGRNVTFISLV